MAEGARLESVYTGNRIVGSNPTPSAKSLMGQTGQDFEKGEADVPGDARQILEAIVQTRQPCDTEP